MKRLVALVVATVVVLSGLLIPAAPASAGTATDVALGLAAFAVFNQIVAPLARPHVVAPAPVVVVPAPRPVVVYRPAPPVVYYPAPHVVVRPAPVVVVHPHGHHGRPWHGPAAWGAGPRWRR